MFCDDCHNEMMKVYPWRDRFMCYSCFTKRVKLDPITLKKYAVNPFTWEDAMKERQLTGKYPPDIYPEEQKGMMEEVKDGLARLFWRPKEEEKKTYVYPPETRVPEIPSCPNCKITLNSEADGQLHWCEQCGFNKPSMEVLMKYITEVNIFDKTS